MLDHRTLMNKWVAVAVLVLLAVAVAGPVLARPVDEGEGVASWWTDTLAWVAAALGWNEPAPEPEPAPKPPNGGEVEAGSGGDTDGGGKWDPDG